MSSIVTFYSYKGGVGRSMALANIAVELARKGKKVLMVDWDLEAPGLEKYFSTFKIENSSEGLMQLLNEYQNNAEPDYRNFLWQINLDSTISLSLLHSGREKDPANYSAMLGNFEWGKFFRENEGGIHLENLRQQWLQDFDIVLIDSRTGLSDASNICTVLMPDILVPMFTANYQSLFGISDIVKFIQTARQNLEVDRMALTILPLPSRFGTRAEFKQSQEWLDRIADILKDSFSDWLPRWIEPRYILELVKIPHVEYFSFGEKLAVVEQGINDPEGMGYIYSKISSLLASEFKDIESLVGKEYYQSKKEKYENSKKSNIESNNEFEYDVFIIYPRPAYQWVMETLVPALTEYLLDELGFEPKIFVDSTEVTSGDSWQPSMENALQKSKTFLVLLSNSMRNDKYLSLNIQSILNKEKDPSVPLIFPLLIHGEFIPSELKNRQYIDLKKYFINTPVKSTKFISEFGGAIGLLARAIANSVEKISSTTFSAEPEKTEKGNLEKLLQIAKDYEEIRKTMSHGNERTSIMANMVSSMKSLFRANDSFLPLFANSNSAGERLIAISRLQEYPDINYLNWLSQHVGSAETWFVGYQASVALYAAAKNLVQQNKITVATAIENALQNIERQKNPDPRQRSTLLSAQIELKLKEIV